MNSLYFEMPNDRSKLKQIIESVGNCHSVGGKITFTENTISIYGWVSVDTGFLIGGRGVEVGNFGSSTNLCDSDWIGIIASRKLPGFLHFNSLYFDDGIIGLDNLKTILKEFICRFHYSGSVSFYQESLNQLYCQYDMTFGPWQGDPETLEAGPQPARIKISYYDYALDQVAPVVIFCREHGFKEYTPKIQKQQL